MELLTCEDIQCSLVFSISESISEVVNAVKRKLAIESERTSRMMKQHEPFRCKIYHGMKYCEICLRHLDCSFNANRHELRKFILDHVNMATCMEISVPCILLYGFQRSMELAAQHVISHILRHSTGPPCRFILCIGLENDPVCSLLNNCKKHLNGFCTIIRSSSSKDRDIRSSLAITKSPKSKKQDTCERLVECLLQDFSHQTNFKKYLSAMKDVDAHIMNTSEKLSSTLKSIIKSVCNRNDVTEDVKRAIVEKCCRIDADFPNVGNNKIIPIVLGELFTHWQSPSENDA